MNNKTNIPDIMSFTDDRFIKEADPSLAKKQKTKRRAFVFGTVGSSVAACLLITVVILQLIPGGSLNVFDDLDILKYKDSKYYGVIAALDQWRDTDTVLWSDNKNDFVTVPDGVVVDGEGVDGEQYVEVTDNQVSGVIEEDFFKRSDKYLYYLEEGILRVYSIEKEESKQVACYYNLSDLHIPQGIYLSSDCKTVTAVFKNSYIETVLVSLDVSDVNNIKQKACVKISGCYLSSRVIDGELFVINSFSVDKNVNFSREDRFIPSMDTGDGMRCIEPEDIYIPQKVSSGVYTVFSRFDENSLEKKDCGAFLSYLPDIYVSQNTAYLTCRENVDQFTVNTNIIGVDFSGQGFKVVGDVTVKGVVKDQYSLDEYNGMLRVVTTTYGKKGSNADLYCIDLEKWEIASSVQSFAPYGETVRSVRFDENTAYVCTSVMLSDPVFFFDLSNIENITFKQTDEIEGFSTSLVNFGQGYLLGLGLDGDLGFKLEIYQEDGDKVVSVCKYALSSLNQQGGGYYFLSTGDYKGFYVNREKKLVGLTYIMHYPEGENIGYECRYLLLHFDGQEIKTVFDKPIRNMLEITGEDYEYCDKVRAFENNGYVYIVYPRGLTVAESMTFAD